MRRSYANFTYQARSWTKPRRVVAKVEWHPGELYPRVGFIVTNMARPAENDVGFYNKLGTCEQWIREGKGAIRWIRLSCRSFAAKQPSGGGRFVCGRRGREGCDLRASLKVTRRLIMSAQAPAKRRKSWGQTHFRAPQITRTVILCVACIPLLSRFPTTSPP